MQNKALVVEGGAMRGIFAAGVLDAFLQNEHHSFDFAIGVSAGASNLLGYAARAEQRSRNVISLLATDNRFYSPARFAKGGDLVDVKWLWEESNRRFPIELPKALSRMPLFAAVTNIETGQPEYYQMQMDNVQKVIEATAALPLAYRQAPCFSGQCFADGGVADSIPVREAYRRGARDITVVLSHPLSYQMKPLKAPWLMKRLLGRYPTIAESMLVRAENYNASLDFIRNPPADAVIRVIAPPENFGVKRLTMSRKRLDEGYLMGLQAGQSHLLSRDGINGLTDENCHFCI